MSTSRLNNDQAQQPYEDINDSLEFADFGENVGWAISPEETVFFPEINSHSAVAKFINFGGFAFIFMALQFLLYCKQTYHAIKQAHHSENPEDRYECILRAAEGVFLAVLTGLAIVSSFFILSWLMLPAVAALSAYDIYSDITELWSTRHDDRLTTSPIELESIRNNRKQLWLNLFAHIAMLVFSIFSCLEGPIISTIGTIGCVVASIIPYTPLIYSKIKSFWQGHVDIQHKPSPEIELTEMRRIVLPEPKIQDIPKEESKPKKPVKRHWQQEIGLFAVETAPVSPIVIPTHEAPTSIDLPQHR